MPFGRTFLPRFGALALCTVLLSGCLLSAPSLDPVRQDMQARLPGMDLEPQIQIHLGRLSLGMAKGIARMAMDEEDEEETFALLRHVKGVEVAVYETGAWTTDGADRWSSYVSELGSRRGWVPFATVNEGDSHSSVFFKMKHNEIRGVYLFTLDDDSLVMARFKGPLERVIAEALAQHGDEIADELATSDGAPRHSETPPKPAPAATGIASTSAAASGN
jgi:hypothetical protein